MLAYALLKIMLLLGQRYFVIIYELIAGIPLIVYVCIVRGQLGAPPTEDMLPSEWSQEEKIRFISQAKARREKGKVCMNISLPFIIALAAALVSEIYYPMFMK